VRCLPASVLRSPAFTMAEIKLIRLDRAVAETLDGGVEAFEARYGAKLGEAAETVRGLVGVNWSRASWSRDGTPWGGYLAVDAETAQVVASCAFKAAPDAAGAVEIAYFTFPPFERRGYATAMARRLIDIARAAPDCARITARTLAEHGPSTAILQKVGMRHAGEVIDPEDGRVWEWELPQ
jgi:ribosomal-protein-alanine N-acetyltransferase